jgi:hypothetical protein
MKNTPRTLGVKSLGSFSHIAARKSSSKNIGKMSLIPKGQRAFFCQIASKQPLLKATRLVQNENLFWYFQP